MIVNLIVDESSNAFGAGLEVRMMRHDQQTTIFGIVFWLLFLISIALGTFARYQWLDIAWLLAVHAFAAIASVFFVLEFFRNRSTSADHRPRWLMWVLLDDQQYAKYLQRRRVTENNPK
jgi:hypothetical protein